MSDKLDLHTLRVVLYEWQQMDARPHPDRWEALGQWIESHYAKAEAPPETGVCSPSEAAYWQAVDAGAWPDRPCGHGSLRRSCELCRRDEGIATLRADVARLTAENADLRDKLDTARRQVSDNMALALVEGDRHLLRQKLAQAEAERDAARAEAWAEAIRVVEHQREPLMAHPTLESPSVYLDMVLAALRQAGSVAESVASPAQLLAEVEGLVSWIRTPGNINRDDAIDECARAVSNLAAALRAAQERQP